MARLTRKRGRWEVRKMKGIRLSLSRLGHSEPTPWGTSSLQDSSEGLTALWVPPHYQKGTERPEKEGSPSKSHRAPGTRWGKAETPSLKLHTGPPPQPLHSSHEILLCPVGAPGTPGHGHQEEGSCSFRRTFLPVTVRDIPSVRAVWPGGEGTGTGPWGWGCAGVGGPWKPHRTRAI